ncbi:hypothetical protein JTB14_011196 [Gonioctena quinquepunctata]|nr:hypothetical protein JTB14_011196 [Gonioctena quinquepunctata]
MRKNRRRKIPNKCSKQNYRQVINDMMEIDVDPEAYMDASDTNMSLKAPNTLAEFIIDIPYKSDSNSISDEEDLLATIISVSPPNKGPVGLRERQLSVAESEDSFIIFDSGTDEELEFSEGDSELSEGESELSEGESEDETESEFQDDFDSSSSSVIPCKRVRFAENDDLCEVHPMVQWSFAYRSARKGPWEEYARDRARFIKRITQTEEILAPIFDHKHREKMYKERFQEQNIN